MEPQAQLPLLVGVLLLSTHPSCVYQKHRLPALNPCHVCSAWQRLPFVCLQEAPQYSPALVCAQEVLHHLDPGLMHLLFYHNSPQVYHVDDGGVCLCVG